MSAARLLLIDTSSAVGSVALAIGDELSERTIAVPREQTERVLGIVDALLQEAGLAIGDLDALVFGRGPGSFTGLRVAAAVTQGLALATGKPIVSVSSLAALAQRALADLPASDAAPPIDHALCCMDARMGEVYSGVFRRSDSGVVAEADEALGPPATVGSLRAPFAAVGDGFAAYADALHPVLDAAALVAVSLLPRARDLLPLAREEIRLGRWLPLEGALPVYLRGAEAWKRD